MPLVVQAWGVYLALSLSLHSMFIILLFAAQFALTVTVTTSAFKKYL